VKDITADAFQELVIKAEKTALFLKYWMLQFQAQPL
jgi:hypothetical protein